MRILSIDGGGIRGIVPAVVLGELERRMGRSVTSLFDYLAGTSTGGILALALSLPDEPGRPALHAGQLIEMWEKRSAEFFPHTRGEAVFQIVHERYPAAGMEQVLADYFGDTMLSHATLPVMVTSYDLLAREVVLLTSAAAQCDASTDVTMRLAVRATCAAPTYFEPIELEYGDRKRVLADGGVAAQHPGMCALVESRIAHPDAEVVMISLGTGSVRNPLSWPQMRDWGLLQWARPLSHIFLDAGAKAVDLQLRHLLGSDRYHRLQPELRLGSEELDDSRPENVAMLREDAEVFIRESDRELDDVCRMLTG